MDAMPNATHFQLTVIRPKDHVVPEGVDRHLLPTFVGSLLHGKTDVERQVNHLYYSKAVALNRAEIIATTGMSVVITPMVLVPVGDIIKVS